MTVSLRNKVHLITYREFMCNPGRLPATNEEWAGSVGTVRLWCRTPDTNILATVTQGICISLVKDGFFAYSQPRSEYNLSPSQRHTCQCLYQSFHTLCTRPSGQMDAQASLCESKMLPVECLAPRGRCNGRKPRGKLDLKDTRDSIHCGTIIP